MLRVDVSVRALLWTLGLLLALLMLVRLWPLLVLLSVSLVLMVALQPYLTWLVRHRVPRALAIPLVVATPLLVIVGALGLTFPALTAEFTDIDRHLPAYAREADAFLEDWGIALGLEERARGLDLREYAAGTAADLGQPLLFFALSALTTIVLTAYLLADAPRLAQFTYHFVPRGQEAEFTVLLERLQQVVGGYIRAQALTSAAIALYTLGVLFLAGAPNPLAFAVIAGFADVIPVVGAWIAVVPAVLAAAGSSPEQAAVVLVLLVAYQQFEDRFLAPRIYGSMLNLPPLVVFIAVLAGAELLGIIGIMLSLPAVAAGRVLLEYLARHRAAVSVPLTPEDDVLAPDEPAATRAEKGAVA